MNSPASSATLSARHYQALCGLTLAAIFLVQMQQNIDLLVNVLMLFLGSCSILYRTRLSPLFVFLAIAGGQLLEQYQQNQFFGADFRSFRFLNVEDMLLCMATLTYLLGQYRLHGLWFHILSYDGREEAPAIIEAPAKPSQARSEASMTGEEIVWLVVPVPICALAAQWLSLLLRQQGSLLDLPPWWKQFLTLTWLLLLVMTLAAQFFRYWRRTQMDLATAQLLLQDVLWHETRGEQRRINRWIVWRKLKQQEEAD